MITTLKNPDGFVEAYCEWEIVDKNGQFQNGGEYCYIQNIWIHPDYIKTNYFKCLIQEVAWHKFMGTVKYVYWNRDKYEDRLSKCYPIKKFIKGEIKYGK